MFVRCGAKALDVQGAALFGGKHTGGAELELLEPGIAKQVYQESSIRFSGGNQSNGIAGLLQGGGEKPITAGPEFSVMISAMRSHPEDPVIQPGGSFQIGFRKFRID